jgi:S-DNA-T family DNA segregation ATPase FtsK/SpoIIIE
VLTQWHAEKIVVPPDVEGAWDALEAVGERAHEKSTSCLVAVDDVDALVARFDDDHRDAVLERLRSLLVDGPRASIAVVCSAVSLPTGLRPVAAQFGERLLLRYADRQEHVLAGAPAELFEADAPPGRGVWHGRAAQVVFIEPSSSDEIGRAEHGEKRPNGYVAGGEQSPPALSFPSGSVTAVVSVSPARTIRRLREACPGLEVIDLESGVKSYGDDSLRRLDPGAVA